MDPLCHINPIKHQMLPDPLKTKLFEGMAKEQQVVPLKVSVSEKCTLSHSMITLPRPPSQKYMEVARSLRGGKHRGESLRQAL